MADFLGRKGRTWTFQPLYLGKNTGTTQYEPVDPAATFFAGELAHKDPITGLIRLAVGTGSAGGDDQKGGVLGFFGDTNITTPVQFQWQETQVVVASGTVPLQFTNVQPSGATGTFASILVVSGTGSVASGSYLLGSTVNSIFINGSTNLSKGLLALNATVAAGTVLVGDVVAINYYYQPNDKHFAVGTNELAPNGAVTIWKMFGEYKVGIFETLSNTGASGLPAINDPMYCSANGRLTSYPVGGFPTTSEVLAICRSTPSIKNPWILVDTRI